MIQTPRWPKEDEALRTLLLSSRTVAAYGTKQCAIHFASAILI